ncbi:hypothetical protein V7014_04145 [Bacillus sp. JJ722]
MFHTDRGREFDNQEISVALETFSIQRSQNLKGCSYDNAVAKVMFKVLKQNSQIVRTSILLNSSFLNLMIMLIGLTTFAFMEHWDIER